MGIALIEVRRYIQEDFKRLEDTEKIGREVMSEKLEGLLEGTNNHASHRHGPEAQKASELVEELYVIVLVCHKRY